MRKLNFQLWFGLFAAIAGLAQNASAVAIYQDSLIGTGGALHDSQVDSSTGLYGGTLNAKWAANAGITETAGGASYGASMGAFLPLAVEDGVIYKLTATVEKTSGTNGYWVALGFSDNKVSALSNQFSAGGHYAWTLVRPNAPGSSLPQFFAGSGTSGQVSTPLWTSALKGQQTVSITLDTTTAGSWTIQSTIGVTSSNVFTYTYSNLSQKNALISHFQYVGFGTDNTANNLVKNFSLTATPVPEPGSVSLMLLGMAGLWRMRQQWKRIR